MGCGTYLGNSGLSFEIWHIILYMDYDYPLLRKIFNHYKTDNINLSETKLFACQHLLAPQLKMFELFIKFGLKPENITILGKAYSSNTGVIDELKQLGTNVTQPTFGGISFDQEHAHNCKKIIDTMSDADTNIMLDDGGFLIYEARNKHVSFAVEQTSSGFRKLENTELPFPVLNVARSKTKLIQESPIIGGIIFERIKSYIEGKHISSPKVLILGLGPIGNSLLKILAAENFSVSGFDVEKDKESILAYLNSEKPDLVIGATGATLFSAQDLDKLDSEHVYYFISVSSSDREFPVVPFRKNSQVHDDVGYKNFVFVNNGFPITFKGNRYEGTPMQIEKTIGLLMGCVLHGLVHGTNKRKGIIEIPSDLEELVNSD